jgi:hypothetical protein
MLEFVGCFNAYVTVDLLCKCCAYLQVCLTEVLYSSIICRPVVTVLLSISSGADIHEVSVVSSAI